MEEFENWLHNIIDKYFFQVAIAVLLLLSAAIRWKLAPVTEFSSDYRIFLQPWIEHYREYGIVEGLRLGVGNYYIPYNLFLAVIAQLPGDAGVYISWFSCLFDYVLAYFVYRIALVLQKPEEIAGTATRKAIMAGIVTLYLPPVILDSTLWKQCDSIYTCFVIICLYYILLEKYGRSLFWLGCGLTFKFQALFIFPLFVALYMFRKEGLRLWQFFWLPALYVLGGMPALLVGRGKRDVLSIYLNQYGSGYAISENHPNVYRLVIPEFDTAMKVYDTLNHPALFGTLAVFAFFMCMIWKYKETVCGAKTIYLGLWCIWTCIMFLPGMHDRYSYPVVILLTMFAIVCDTKKLWVAFVINAVTTIIFASYLFGGGRPSFTVLSLFYVVPYFYVTYDLYRSLQKETPP